MGVEIAEKDKNAISHYKLGRKFYVGEDGQTDYTRAYEAFEKAAQLGHVDAIYKVGYMLCKGEGIEKNLEKGYNYLKAAEQNGHEKAAVLIKKIEELRRRE